MDSKYDSCTAVFSTLGSPFLEASCSRSHYHPSQAQPLKAEQQYMVLSPSCLQHKSFSTSPKKVEALSPPSPTFLPDTSYQEVKPHKSDSTSSFNESWPSTERSSSSITPEGAKEFPSEPAPASPKPPDSVTDSESVIARYIERFRYGQPTNRRERGAPHGHSAEFWWLGHSFPPECNISKKEASPASGSLGAFPCHTTQRSLSCSSKPENDILFQWRLRRKMEEASKAIAVMPNQIQPIYASSMVERTAWKSSEPACWRSRDGRVLPATETQLRVESALHECHPCCHTNFMKNGLTSPHHIETTPSTNGIVVAGSPEPKREQGVKGAAPPEGPVSAYPESSPPLRPAGTRNLLSQSTFHNVQQSAQPVKRVHAEPRGNQKAFRTKQGQAKPIGDHRELPASPIKHSIQHVLGEVVAERLFSPPESPGLHWDKQKRNSKNLSLEAALPSAVAAPSHSQLLNMAAQLLEQAEDSDGTEFEDDPLLQVLRAQRELLRSQLRAVDVRVVQLEGHHSDQDFSHR
ncbi:proline and serine-rich protein 3 isoform X2 [Rhineura floridana]|uniref:proline and serine-rich protein 3 isoform X2 n=1 Tax=Rhineura floridana TaxID=261503 RepID=UPI002AC7F63F|nr:proline and serine-rich protein 3 isoform X2 [Rhineura floridana]